VLAAALDGAIEVAHNAFLVLNSLMDKNLQPISDKAEGLLAQMPNTRHAKALFSTCGADSRAKLSQSRVMLNGLQPAVVPGHCMKTSDMPKFENTKTLAETPKFINAL